MWWSRSWVLLMACDNNLFSCFLLLLTIQTVTVPNYPHLPKFQWGLMEGVRGASQIDSLGRYPKCLTSITQGNIFKGNLQTHWSQSDVDEWNSYMESSSFKYLWVHAQIKSIRIQDLGIKTNLLMLFWLLCSSCMFIKSLSECIL